MYEKKKGQTNALPVLRKNLEHIPVSSDPLRRVYVSGMSKAPSPAARVRERSVSLFDVMDKVGSVVGFLASMAMIYLVIRVSYGVVWI